MKSRQAVSQDKGKLSKERWVGRLASLLGSFHRKIELSNVTPLQKNLIKAPRPIYMAYFFEPGCRLCDSTIASILARLNKDFPQLEIRYSNVAQEEHRLMQVTMGKLYEVPLEERLVTPAIYVGKHYFIHEIDFREVEKVVKAKL